MGSPMDTDIGEAQPSYGDNADSGAYCQRPFPQKGHTWEEIRQELVYSKRTDYNWKAGRVPIYVYYDDEELLSVSREAYNLYFSENMLGRRAFPSLVKLEEDVIGATLSLFNAPTGAGGSFTSGGTESIFLAVKCARDRFRALRGRSMRGSIVIPRTAHPAFDKAAHYLDVDVIRTSVTADLRADVSDLARAINASTILIAGSAPCYPYGVFDPISSLGEIAKSYDVWLHVDACLGGFLAPFAKAEGYPIPMFDFLVDGVWSLSADVHKYGFSAKGSSMLLYRSAQSQKHQGFRFDDWPRGSYSTDTFLGSRSGGAIASAWAVIHYLGFAGYRRLAKKTMQAKQRLMDGIERIPGLKVVRPTELSILLYKSVDEAIDINAVAEELIGRGWFVGRSREPQAIHLALNAVHSTVIESYLSDLRAAVALVKDSGRIAVFDTETY